MEYKQASSKTDCVYTFNKQITDDDLFNALLSRLAKVEGIAGIIATGEVSDCDPKYFINCFWAITGFTIELTEISEEIQNRYFKKSINTF